MSIVQKHELQEGFVVDKYAYRRAKYNDRNAKT